MALKYKGNISDALKGSVDIQTSKGLSIGSVYSLFKVARDLAA